MRKHARRIVALLIVVGICTGFLVCPKSRTPVQVQADQDRVEWDRLLLERSRLIADLKARISETGNDWCCQPQMEDIGRLTDQLHAIHNRHPDWPPLGKTDDQDKGKSN